MTSPRIADDVLARHPAASRAPAAHTAAELARLSQLVRAAGVGGVAIGHGRHPTSVAAAEAFVDAWTAGGGTVLAVVDWPSEAASWLRPARRLTSCHPDGWVIADTPAGCAQVSRRLAAQPEWSASRTFGFGSLASADLVALAGAATLTGMTGATGSGGTWRVGHGLLFVNDATPLSGRPGR
jgi:hypothetical protein